jgi:hypothetical protein
MSGGDANVMKRRPVARKGHVPDDERNWQIVLTIVRFALVVLDWVVNGR